MHPHLQEITKAADGLLYMSESDYPFEAVELTSSLDSPEADLKKISAQPEDAAVEKVSLAHFFRNMKTQQAKALQQIIQDKLADAEVYRIGSIQIDAFIIGKLEDGSYAGLKTKIIET